MTDNNSIINVGELSKPASVLIEKVSEAIGGIFKPWQIRRVAEAEADAEHIRAATEIKITKQQRRALMRLIAEEAKKQSNIEKITALALPGINADAKPQDMEDDWIVNFFDKCRLITNEEMQILWSRVLTGEANAPGKFSKRTVNFLGSLDKSDATLFQALCRFSWYSGDVYPIIYDTKKDIYNDLGIDFASIKHLDEIGLLSFDYLSSYRLLNLNKYLTFFYYGKPVKIEFENDTDNGLDIGHVILSKVGQELSLICGSKPFPSYFNYIIGYWKETIKLKITIPGE